MLTPAYSTPLQSWITLFNSITMVTWIPLITLVLLVNKVSYCNLFFYFHSNLRLSIGAILISVTSVFLIKTKFLGSVFVAFKVYFVRDPVSDNSTSLVISVRHFISKFHFIKTLLVMMKKKKNSFQLYLFRCESSLKILEQDHE